VVTSNNQLIAAGEVETDNGTFAVKIPSSFNEQRDVYQLPVKVDGDRVITLGDLADIRLTFEDRAGTARFNGENTVALQVVKRKGFNLIDTAAMVRDEVEAEKASWPEELQAAIDVGTSNDQSRTVASMVSQLEGSVLTAIALVMIVVLAALGTRSALLVGFAIPTSFLLCFAFLAVMEVSVSNIVMFGLILAVGMLVDGAIVVVEYADRRIKEGSGPMAAYVEAAKRMFWPIVSSTATTLCAFLPMLFWPGVPGQFMGMLPVTLIFVLSASLVVALIYLPVMGGVAGRLSRGFEGASDALRARLPWLVCVALVPIAIYMIFVGAMQVLNHGYIFGGERPLPPMISWLPGVVIFLFGSIFASITMGASKIQRLRRRIDGGYRRTIFGYFISFLTGNPIMPLVAIGAVMGFVMVTFTTYGANNKGVDFFVDSEPEQAIVYVRARGNLSVSEKDRLVGEVEDVILDINGVDSAFAFAGAGGLNSNTGGAAGPRDTIGQVQVELTPWEERPVVEIEEKIFGFIPFNREAVDPRFDGDFVLEDMQARLNEIPGIKTEILNLSRGPASGKPVHLRLSGENWSDLLIATETVRQKYEGTDAIIDIEDSRPLPGIDWQIDVDVEKAGRYGANVATVGGMVQLVTRGIFLDTMRVDSSDEEIEIRVRLPEQDRVLSTLDTLKVRTPDGLVPLSNFITRKPVEKLAQIDRIDQKRYFDVKADVTSGLETLLDEDDTPIAIIKRLSDVELENRDPSTLLKNDIASYEITKTLDPSRMDGIGQKFAEGDLSTVSINGNERIAELTKWIEEESPFPAGIDWEWTGDQEEQEESGQFLMTAFAGALGLMFIILLAQFNSFYNAALVLLAVVLSTAGVLIGMLVMEQPFSIIMTGTGIVALAGIVVNNNIVLIDTYQEYSRYMPRIEAIIRTAEVRIRPVLLTTITTMAGLTPMMFGLSLDFIGGGYSVDSPTALWWKQLATAVVFGLGIATMLTLIFTPSMLALRVWITTYASWFAQLLAKLSMGRTSRAAKDWALAKEASRVKAPELIWQDAPFETPIPPEPTSQAALAQEETDQNASSEAESKVAAEDLPPTGGVRAAE
jgi:multidrug efflux pump